MRPPPRRPPRPAGPVGMMHVPHRPVYVSNAVIAESLPRMSLHVDRRNRLNLASWRTRVSYPTRAASAHRYCVPVAPPPRPRPSSLHTNINPRPDSSKFTEIVCVPQQRMHSRLGLLCHNGIARGCVVVGHLALSSIFRFHLLFPLIACNSTSKVRSDVGVGEQLVLGRMGRGCGGRGSRETDHTVSYWYSSHGTSIRRCCSVRSHACTTT